MNKIRSAQKVKLVVVIGIIVGLSAVVLKVGSHNGKKLDQLTLSNSNSSSNTGVLGASFRGSDYQIGVTNMTISPTNSQTGLKHVLLAVTIKNLSSRTLQISPGLQMFLMDELGNNYSYTAEFNNKGDVIGGPMPSSASTILNVDYNIPDSATPKLFVFQYDAGSAPVNLGL